MRQVLKHRSNPETSDPLHAQIVARSLLRKLAQQLRAQRGGSDGFATERPGDFT